MNGESSLYDPSPVSDTHFISAQIKSLNFHYFKNVKYTISSTQTMETSRLRSHWMYTILWPTLPQFDSGMLQPQKLTTKSSCKTSHVHLQHKSNISVPCSVCTFNFTSELMWQVTNEDFSGTHVVWISFITLFHKITCYFSFLAQFIK